MNIIISILFIISFYFTILRQLTWLSIFELHINSLPATLGEKENYFFIILNWLMWFFQIAFWSHYFKLI